VRTVSLKIEKCEDCPYRSFGTYDGTEDSHSSIVFCTHPKFKNDPIAREGGYGKFLDYGMLIDKREEKKMKRNFPKFCPLREVK
jgi:hypothetical protein